MGASYQNTQLSTGPPQAPSPPIPSSPRVHIRTVAVVVVRLEGVRFRKAWSDERGTDVVFAANRQAGVICAAVSDRLLCPGMSGGGGSFLAVLQCAPTGLSASHGWSGSSGGGRVELAAVAGAWAVSAVAAL
jgi:hypothetical protein